MDVQTFFKALPNVTKYYLLINFITTFAITYVKAVPAFYYMYLDYDKILFFEVFIFYSRSGDCSHLSLLLGSFHLGIYSLR
jgi:hypothetical protein